MPIDMDWSRAGDNLLRIGIAFALAFPSGWERGSGRASVGFRTVPIVAMASCGFALLAASLPGASAESLTRMLQGLATGIGFVGGGAILKDKGGVKGVVTAASIWNTGAIGASVALGRLEIAVALSVLNLLTLVVLSPVAERLKTGVDGFSRPRRSAGPRRNVRCGFWLPIHATKGLLSSSSQAKSSAADDVRTAMPHWLFNAVQFARQLWVRVAIFSVVGLVAALVAVALAPWVPQDFALKIGSGAVDQVLGILATSMLSVATFSLATLVTAYTAISASATPRAATLLVAGGRGQSALATFVGAFIYAVTGIFALQTGYYGAQGRVILFFFTVGVLLAVITALLRWIDQLSKLGRVGEAIDRVADATLDAFDAKLSRHGRPPCGAAPDDATVIAATAVGYVRNIDVDRLEALASKHGLTVFVDAAPGDFVHGARPLFRYDGRLSTGLLPVADLAACWNIAGRRSFDQDPRFGLTVLGEIAARALSPGINDPGTAIDVISTAVRLLTAWAGTTANPAEASFEHLRIKPLSPRSLLQDVFTPIAQYGAGNALVAATLQQAFVALSRLDDPELAEAAVAEAALALKRAEAALSLEDDQRAVRNAACL